MILQDTIKEASKVLKKYNIASPTLDAEVILSNIIGVSREFLLVNNNLRLFPIPNGSVTKLYFEYIKNSDRNNPYEDGTDKITNVSNVPFQNPNYNEINSIGRQWIFEYSLAIAKEILGYIRGKYSTIPIPDADVTLNQGDLISAATSEKNALIERLRAYFDETSRKSLMERRKDEGAYLRDEFNNVPYTIFIG